MISFEEALERTLAGAGRLGVERVPTADAAGRVLARDLTSPRPMPAFTYSAVDGYGVCAAELAGAAPHTLRVAGESRAGGALPAHAPGCATRIFTGAELPVGVDTVIMQEAVERAGELVTLGKTPKAGANVRHAGEDVAEGALALATGTRLHPGAVALAAALDHAHLYVGRRPVVAILPTGDELRAPGDPAGAGDTRSIPDSNSFALAAIARAAGAIVRSLPPLCDEDAATEAALREALVAADLCVTIGGVSVGDHDRVRPALDACGIELAYWGVAIKPGKPTAFGRRADGTGARVLSVPGNPAAATVVFTLLGVPLLRALQGDAHPVPAPTRLPVRGALRHTPGRMELLRARLVHEAGDEIAVLAANQASGAVVGFAHADALVVVPRESDAVHDGERLPVYRLRELWS
ncbi:MAG: molybdopterin molybdotransferase MoeA [Myxococcales bacterium]|nr:molybdopterin molybdotransferase MoeA [Myxococcales bacterium]